MYIVNATLSYNEVTSTQTGTDPITGEPIFETSTSASTMLLSLEQKQTQARTSELPGKDITGIYCEGRAMAADNIPRSTVPSWYKDDLTVDITWENGKCGKFYVLPTINSRFGLEECFGYKIKGILLNNE